MGFLNEAEVLGLCRSRTNDASVDVSWSMKRMRRV